MTRYYEQHVIAWHALGWQGEARAARAAIARHRIAAELPEPRTAAGSLNDRRSCEAIDHSLADGSEPAPERQRQIAFPALKARMSSAGNGAIGVK